MKISGQNPIRQALRGVETLPHPQEQLVSPGWLLGLVVGALCLAALCIYGTFCLYFWQNQWQLVFHPSHDAASTDPAGLKYQNLRFDAADSGVLQLDGWWIPAESTGRFAGDTVLFLRGGSGSLPRSAAQLRALHSLGVNVFAFDYRGFGASAKIHPSERSVSEDTDAAWRYLTDTRHLAPGTIAIYGVRLGAAIAAEAALRHPQVRGLILEDPQPPILDILGRNRYAKLLPFRLLSHDRFDPAQTLAHLPTPKLFLSTSGGEGSNAGRQPELNTPLLYRRAAAPKVSVFLASRPGALPDSSYADPSYMAALNQFFGEYLPRSLK